MLNGVENRYNRYPDEKGTESRIGSLSERARQCYNRYPDEKGTESLVRDRVHRFQRVLGYNRYPDEKGTESLTEPQEC